MNFDVLKSMYLEEERNNPDAHNSISDFFESVKARYTQEYRTRRPDGDAGQSWRAWKGKNFEKLVLFIIERRIEVVGQLKAISGATLEKELTDERLSRIKRNIVVDFGKVGCFVPDADIVVYSEEDESIKAIISCKITLRERIAQTAFWKLKLNNNPVTNNIRTFFVTPDEDGTLDIEKTNKSKAIVVNDIDAVYVLKQGFVEHYNIYNLDKLVSELRKCL